MSARRVRKAVIPIAGLGSRFLPATKCIPKEILPVYDRPVIELIVRELAKAGVEEVIFVVPPEGSVTPNHFYANEWLEKELRKKGKDHYADEIRALARLVKVATVVQQEPLGDGHAILQAEDLVGDNDFFAFFGDEIFDAEKSSPEQLLTAGEGHNKCVLGILEVHPEETHKFGIVESATKIENGSFEISSFVEKPAQGTAPSNYALIGKNLCTPEIFSALRHAKVGIGGELRLVDAFIELRKTKSIFGRILTGERFDVGNPDGLLAASSYFSQKNSSLQK
ncbi:UTP--glucose-1-phosphate uridylyltransferase [Candidatus Peregrinibacteria bacterium]|nr:MAG: UTP--glucose-1-phosphate uridylyltransferase [Candidatus Peregrinibacteria bacterium]